MEDFDPVGGFDPEENAFVVGLPLDGDDANPLVGLAWAAGAAPMPFDGVDASGPMSPGPVEGPLIA